MVEHSGRRIDWKWRMDVFLCCAETGEYQENVCSRQKGQKVEEWVSECSY